jgi:acetolactate synthase-1/2/3 large subunit
MKKTGAQIFFECLVREGVDTVFGYPGGVVLAIYDKLKQYPQLTHYLCRHEQAAVHMADGYARATGKVGVALATSGPGATNTVTGLATAMMDSIPLVCFTGQVPTHLIGNDAFQEADIVGISRPATKHNYLVNDVKDLARIIREAFYIARTGRPGPVLVDMPKDVIMGTTEFVWPERVSLRGYNPTTSGHPGQIQKALDRIFKAERPVILAGGGIIWAEASEELQAFSQRLTIPVITTLMGLGCHPSPHPLNLDLPGMHGTYEANMALQNADVLIGLGARFDDRVTGKLDRFAPKADIIHVDIDPSSIGKNVPTAIPIVGDLKDVLRRLLDLTKDDPRVARFRDGHDAWIEQLHSWRQSHPLFYKAKDGVIKPQFVIEKLYELTRGDAIITTEVGQHQMWAAQFYHFSKPRRWITSGGLGTMGYGFPAAIGAQVAHPDQTVIDIAGDGSIQMNIQELATATQYRLPVKIAILNNNCLGMVRQWQELFYERNYSEVMMAGLPDYVKLADAYGAVGLRATRPEEVVPVIKKALSVQTCVVMDFVVEQDENVYPMVAAGKALDEMLLLEA